MTRSFKVVLRDGTTFEVHGVAHIHITDWWRFYTFLDSDYHMLADVPAKLLKYAVESRQTQGVESK